MAYVQLRSSSSDCVGNWIFAVDPMAEKTLEMNKKYELRVNVFFFWSVLLGLKMMYNGVRVPFYKYQTKNCCFVKDWSSLISWWEYWLNY